jgi:hypothetical protein
VVSVVGVVLRRWRVRFLHRFLGAIRNVRRCGKVDVGGLAGNGSVDLMHTGTDGWYLPREA